MSICHDLLISTSKHIMIEMAARIVKIDIGIGIFISAMEGEAMLTNLAKQLHIPKAVPHNFVGKTKGVDT